MTERITVATVNTHMGEVFKTPQGLEALAEADILLMQEVCIEEYALSKQLAEYDFSLTVLASGLGLAIAHRQPLDYIETQVETVQPESKLSDLASGQTRFRMRARGLLSAVFQTREDSELAVATTHPTVPLRFRSRARHVSALPAVLPHGDRLVVAGDMNHWPGPRKVDTQFRDEAGLHAVAIGQQPTFDVSRTRYSWLEHAEERFGIPINGQLDAMLYRGDLEPEETTVVDVPSDHRAIMTRFVLTAT
jgi:endonuclease/exonuclease/phosphatase family metal-dependent hydrolase